VIDGNGKALTARDLAVTLAVTARQQRRPGASGGLQGHVDLQQRALVEGVCEADAALIDALALEQHTVIDRPGLVAGLVERREIGVEQCIACGTGADLQQAGTRRYRPRST